MSLKFKDFSTTLHAYHLYSQESTGLTLIQILCNTTVYYVNLKFDISGCNEKLVHHFATLPHASMCYHCATYQGRRRGGQSALTSIGLMNLQVVTSAIVPVSSPWAGRRAGRCGLCIILIPGPAMECQKVLKISADNKNFSSLFLKYKSSSSLLITLINNVSRKSPCCLLSNVSTIIFIQKNYKSNHHCSFILHMFYGLFQRKYHTPAWQCQSVLRTTMQGNGKEGNSTPTLPETPEPLVT